MDLREKVRGTIQRHRMLQPGDRVGVAVSGGADSVALLVLLDELKAALGLTLRVVHFNHQLRGASSDKDEQFVAALAAQHGLEFLCEREDVAAAAHAQRLNLEEAARQLRYGFFQRVVAEGRVTRVAVAHTADDQAETVLAHLLRGTGLTGLAGIYPVAGCVVRPLLEVRRAELRAFLTACGQGWREDATNQDTTRLRARIRQRLLPLLEQEFQPDAVAHLASLAELAHGDEAGWRAILEIFCRDKVEKTADGVRIQISHLDYPFAPEPAPSGTLGRPASDDDRFLAPVGLQRRIVRQVVEELAGHRRRLSAHHVEQVLRLAHQAAGGAELHLPGGIRVRRTLGFHLEFHLEKEGTRVAPQPYEYAVDLAASGIARFDVPPLGKRFTLKLIDCSGGSSDTRDAPEALDFERLRPPLVFRNWRPGDSFRPPGHQRAHKLKRLFWEKGIDARDRGVWPVMVSARQVVWVRGFPPAEELALGPGTRTALMIEEEQL